MYVAYQRATRDDMRIFGLCINGHQCRIRKVHHMKTLILESKANFTARQIKEMLSFVLGPDSYTFHLTDSKGTRVDLFLFLPYLDLLS